jgi:CO dehydrogenase nickel-insertion accessory protein CooC1
VVADANRKSLEVAGTIWRMARDSAIGHVGLVANRIAGSLQEQVVRSFAEANGMPIFAIIPFDQEISDSGITGEPVNEERSAAIREIARLATVLESGSLPETADGTP